MVKFILGEKGVGKTKWLVEKANKDMNDGNENIVFIDVDDDHIFTLDSKVRLINAMEFNISNVESFYGFLCGMLGMNYDLEKVYVDSIYKEIELSIEDIESLYEKLNIIGKKFNTKFFINLESTFKDMPKHIREASVEL